MTRTQRHAHQAAYRQRFQQRLDRCEEDFIYRKFRQDAYEQAMALSIRRNSERFEALVREPTGLRAVEG